jgi:hypothetical protein
MVTFWYKEDPVLKNIREMLFWHHFSCPTTIFILSYYNLIFYYFIVSHILPKLSTLTTILVIQISLLFFILCDSFFSHVILEFFFSHLDCPWWWNDYSKEIIENIEFGRNRPEKRGLCSNDPKKKHFINSFFSSKIV